MARHVIFTKFTQEDGALVGKILFIRNSKKYQNKKFLSSKTMLQLVGLFNSRYWVLIGY